MDESPLYCLKSSFEIIKKIGFQNLEIHILCHLFMLSDYFEKEFLYCYTHCSGQAAVITPRQVISGLGSRRVMAIAAAKHHTVVATQGGEVFTWGSNRGKT